MLQSTIKLGIDIDSVIADILPPWINFYNTEYGDNLCIDQITEWSINKFTKPECGLKIFEYLERPDFYEHVKPIEGAIEGIELLREYGFKIYYVSACVPNTMDQKVRWMQKYIKSFDWKQLCFSYDKSIIDVDALIDDGPHNLDASPGYISTIRFDQPYNTRTAANAHAKDWSNMVETVKEALITRQRYRKGGELVHVAR